MKMLLLVRLVVILVVWRLVIAAKFEASEKSVAVTYVLCLLKVSSNWEVSANPTPTKKTRPNPPPIASTNIVFNVMRWVLHTIYLWGFYIRTKFTSLSCQNRPKCNQRMHQIGFQFSCRQNYLNTHCPNNCFCIQNSLDLDHLQAKSRHHMGGPNIFFLKQCFQLGCQLCFCNICHIILPDSIIYVNVIFGDDDTSTFFASSWNQAQFFRMYPSQDKYRIYACSICTCYIMLQRVTDV